MIISEVSIVCGASGVTKSYSSLRRNLVHDQKCRSGDCFQMSALGIRSFLATITGAALTICSTKLFKGLLGCEPE
jgi:hypothetical protein